jgi:hypothetical protein
MGTKSQTYFGDHIGHTCVLQLVDETDRSAYDCGYVALAQVLDAMLVTGDKTVVDLIPDTAVLLEDFAAGGG